MGIKTSHIIIVKDTTFLVPNRSSKNGVSHLNDSLVNSTVVSYRELRLAQGMSGYFFEADILYTGNNLEICIKEGNYSFVAWIQRV